VIKTLSRLINWIEIRILVLPGVIDGASWSFIELADRCSGRLDGGHLLGPALTDRGENHNR
jgi:hypothetical protein